MDSPSNMTTAQLTHAGGSTDTTQKQTACSNIGQIRKFRTIRRTALTLHIKNIQYFEWKVSEKLTKDIAEDDYDKLQ